MGAPSGFPEFGKPDVGSTKTVFSSLGSLSRADVRRLPIWVEDVTDPGIELISVHDR